MCRYHDVPFYIAAPLSTFDRRTASGLQIPIEQRNGEEITSLFFKRPVAPRGVKIFNPAFDVTPHGLISAIITDRGIISPPFGAKIRAL